ncbi:MAG TPA: transposase, partial [Archaeoglobus profundus]|nr:transposase [Archaeoglobus profundus]
MYNYQKLYKYYKSKLIIYITFVYNPLILTVSCGGKGKVKNRLFICMECGFQLDRDLNASRN